jgi:cytochrome c oxidase assembly protein subunit 15
MFRRGISPERYVQFARWSLWSLTVIVVTGGAVRLTGSGLGCSDWPTCEQDQVVPDLEYHALIEFVNRMFTGVVTATVVIAVLGSLRRRPRRPDLVRWSLGLVVGVLAQILLGALLVKTDLDPRFTMGHFLLSMVLLWNAVVLIERARLQPDGNEAPPAAIESNRLRFLTRFVGALGAVLLVTGTIVTGTGPHSGSDDPTVAARLPFQIRDVTRVHSLTAISLLVLVLFTTHQARQRNLERLGSQAGLVATLLLIQGMVGYWQYFAGVPVLLVGIHLTLASLCWISIVRLVWTSEHLHRTRAAS